MEAACTFLQGYNSLLMHRNIVKIEIMPQNMVHLDMPNLECPRTCSILDMPSFKCYIKHNFATILKDNKTTILSKNNLYIN